MGFLDFRQGHLQEAEKWYRQAVSLDSQSYLAHYYFAAIAMMEPLSASDEAQVESSLRTCIKLNPSFAPPYDRLAVFLAMHNRDLDEAHTMGLTAVGLDPANIGYRINVANVLLTLGQGKNAVNVLRFAAKLAKTPAETQSVENMLMHAQEYAMQQEHTATAQASPQGAVVTSITSEAPRLAHREEFVPSGPHRFLTGVLKDIRCDTPEIDLTLDSGGKSLTLHAENYYKIQFTTLGFQPSGDLNPCKDLQGRPAKVEYVESANQSSAARVFSVELHK
jgi:tetratricopeptide (TPR) repeat protein